MRAAKRIRSMQGNNIITTAKNVDDITHGEWTLCTYKRAHVIIIIIMCTREPSEVYARPRNGTDFAFTSFQVMSTSPGCAAGTMYYDDYCRLYRVDVGNHTHAGNVQKQIL